jgi:hypothetical protein
MPTKTKVEKRNVKNLKSIGWNTSMAEPDVECSCGWKGKYGMVLNDKKYDALVCPECGHGTWKFKTK